MNKLKNDSIFNTFKEIVTKQQTLAFYTIWKKNSEALTESINKLSDEEGCDIFILAFNAMHAIPGKVFFQYIKAINSVNTLNLIKDFLIKEIYLKKNEITLNAINDQLATLTKVAPINLAKKSAAELEQISETRNFIELIKNKRTYASAFDNFKNNIEYRNKILSEENDLIYLCYETSKCVYAIKDTKHMIIQTAMNKIKEMRMDKSKSELINKISQECVNEINNILKDTNGLQYSLTHDKNSIAILFDILNEVSTNKSYYLKQLDPGIQRKINIISSKLDYTYVIKSARSNHRKRSPKNSENPPAKRMRIEPNSSLTTTDSSHITESSTSSSKDFETSEHDFLNFFNPTSDIQQFSFLNFSGHENAEEDIFLTPEDVGLTSASNNILNNDEDFRLHQEINLTPEDLFTSASQATLFSNDDSFDCDSINELFNDLYEQENNTSNFRKSM